MLWTRVNEVDPVVGGVTSVHVVHCVHPVHGDAPCTCA
ncbi:MAG: hypothetical protein [Olavius algarvensis Gamma 1 endosymbiont]|nr:MAG: hypothetical protein [Olavius algarvensis Gamma 1 endosymbiont]